MARSLDARAGEPVTGRKRGLYYGWIMVALCSTLLAFSYGARYTFGVFMDPFAREFGWSRSTMSLAFSIFTWLYGVMQIYWGILIERRHPRVVMGLGVIFFGVAVVAMAGMSTLWQLFVLQGVVAAIGFSGMGMVPSSAVVSRWFVRRKGTALSIAFAGVSVGQLVFSPLAMVWILQYGWRISLLIIGGTFVVPGILVVLLARSSPSEMGLLPDGIPVDKPPASTPDSLAPGVAGTVPASKPVVGILQAVRNRAFFFISSAYFVCGFTGHVIGAHLVLWALDQGFSEMTAATALGLMGGTNALGILVMGAVSDRLGRKFPLGLVYLLRGLSFFLIFWARSESSLILFSLVFGFSTFATAPITSALVGDLFGARSVGRLYGAVTLFHQVGAGLGVYLAGLTFDLTGTYLWVFAASAIMLGFAAILSWTAPTGSGCFPVNLRSGPARPARPEGTGARPPA